VVDVDGWAYPGHAIVDDTDEDLDVRQFYGPDGYIHRPTINGLETACGNFSTTHLVWRRASYDGKPCRDCYSIHEVAKFIEAECRTYAEHDPNRDIDDVYIGLATGPARPPMTKPKKEEE
jgi:hypothetical protein